MRVIESRQINEIRQAITYIVNGTKSISTLCSILKVTELYLKLDEEIAGTENKKITIINYITRCESQKKIKALYAIIAGMEGRDKTWQR